MLFIYVYKNINFHKWLGNNNFYLILVRRFLSLDRNDCFILLDLFEQDVTDEGPTDLYFKDPFELIHVFRAIETQNLNALIHLETLAEPLTDLVMMIATAEGQIMVEVTEITNTINELQVII